MILLSCNAGSEQLENREVRHCAPNWCIHPTFLPDCKLKDGSEATMRKSHNFPVQSVLSSFCSIGNWFMDWYD